MSHNPALKALQKYFAYNSFQGLQEKVINRIIQDKKHTLVLMPTGSGKSLCYQIPALILPGKTIVISPLIALMQDQVNNLKAKNIAAEYINSTVSRSVREKRIHDFIYGEIKILYVTPERFKQASFTDNIKRVNISLLAVDEAHCISTWGHDFRPDYSRIDKIREILKNPLTIALTATATLEVQKDIIAKLGLESKEIKLFHQGISRPNLRLEVQEVMDDQQKLEHVLQSINKYKGSGIIYFSLIKTLKTFSDFLNQKKIPHLTYHGKLGNNQRKSILNQFMKNDLPVLATNAFGMGVDKSNIRYVIHSEIPGSIESYYQEIGRAGRDSKDSVCSLLYNQNDLLTQMEFIKWSNPEPDYYRRLFQVGQNQLQKINSLGLDFLREQLVYKNRFDFRLETALAMLELYNCISGHPDHGNFKITDSLPSNLIDQEMHDNKILSDRKKLLSVVNYFKTDNCRRQYIEEYFGFHNEPECGNCDICS